MYLTSCIRRNLLINLFVHLSVFYHATGQGSNVNKNSKSNNNNVISQDKKLSPISDMELQRITEELFQRDSCCIYKNITVSYQGWIKGDNITDNAPKP
ncbi:poly(U)-specific endoribonuclease [Vespula maculifrons]|uniref:Poly(U)-specific endoribonuclease n=1 Tax=Vespula maculifrons TaxID=7453 RepID=A0ABD2D2F4_VESMC